MGLLSRHSRSVRPTHVAFRWIVACTAGELVGIATATVAALAFNALVGDPSSPATRLAALALFAAVGAVEGGALAAFQWRVLRARLPRLRAGEWIGATVAVAVAGWVIGMTPSLFMSHDAGPQNEPPLAVVLSLAAAAGAAAGLCFGAAQWIILRRHAERAGRWIWIHVPAWAVAMSAIFLGASLPAADSPGWVIVLSGAAGGVLGGVLLGAVTAPVASRLRPWVDECRWSLREDVCAITGATSAIGREVALGMARLGGTVLLLVRRPAEGERVRQWILAHVPDGDVSIVACDLGNFASIRRAADQIRERYPRVSVLVHNAGTTPRQRTLTVDGIETTLAVDVVGPFLLTALLQPQLEAGCARVIMLTGISQRKGRIDLDDLDFARRPYAWLDANAQAQRCRWLYISELARRTPRLIAVAVHPGAVLTAAHARLPPALRILIHTVLRPAFVRAEVGAIPVLRLAAQPYLADVTGHFLDRCRVEADVADAAVAGAFWATCEMMTDGWRRSRSREQLPPSESDALTPSRQPAVSVSALLR